MPPASSVSTRSVYRESRSAIQSRAGSIASFPWLEMLGKEHSSLSSSMKRRELFSMYWSTALVEITVPLFHPRNLVVWPRKTPRAQSLRCEFSGSPMTADEFHFSPRPNRAAEINWRPWSAAAFEEAKLSSRPILLSISAVWCHWCHVMDDTTYSHAGIIDLINREYVPIRVDNDVRPDINQRYNMGGWPSTSFFASSADILTGATYLPPDQIADALAKVAGYYRTNQPEIATRVLEARKRTGSAVARTPASLDADLVDPFLQPLTSPSDPHNRA